MVELVSLNDLAASSLAVWTDYAARPLSARACQLGQFMIVKPDDARPEPGLLWIMGFNGGETAGAKDASGDTPSARKWFRLCGEAAKAVCAPACIIGERTHWGSPTVGELVQRVGSPERFRALLKLHANVNLALLRAYRPRAVWMTGLSSYIAEAVEDYGLTSIGEPALRTKRGRLWQEYVDTNGLPWLVTIHPTGARMSTAEFQRVKEKLRDLSVGAN